MSPRPARVYWVRRRNAKDLLVFDRGHLHGDVYVYEFKESHSTKEIRKEMEQHYNVQASDEKMPEFVALWVEKKFGFPTNFDLA